MVPYCILSLAIPYFQYGATLLVRHLCLSPPLAFAFVPIDSAGRTARVEGVVSVKTLTDEMAKHYESEGAIVPRGKDGKPREVQLVASGVELRK